MFSCGTDEHGLKIQKAAAAANVSPKAFCDATSAYFFRLFDSFNVHPTALVRTTDEKHRLVVERVWSQLFASGFIKKEKYSGWYSTVDECFYPIQDVETVSVNNVKRKVSKSTQSVVEWVEEENYMFALSKFQGPIRKWLTENDVIRPKHYLPLALKFLDLGDLSVSRDRRRLTWGIPVPNDHSQTIYVWLDALMNYLTASGYPESRSCWPPTWQLIGKDILKFHAIFWPSFLMAMDLPLPEKIFVHAHWLVDGVKMSKSAGNVVDPFDVARTLTADGLRYFLLRQGVPHDDGNFMMLKAVHMVNSDLVNNLGNLLQRATVKKLNPGQVYPEFNVELLRGLAAEMAPRLIKDLNELRDRCAVHFDNLLMYKALDAITACSRQTNNFFQASEPWKLSSANANPVLYITYEAIRICSILLQAAVPDYAARSLTRLGFGREERSLESAVFGGGKFGPFCGRPLDASGDLVMERIKFEGQAPSSPRKPT